MFTFQHMMVCLACQELDSGLLRYATMLARLATPVEVRLVHVITGETDDPASEHHDCALDAIESNVREHFADVPESVKTNVDVLKGPLLDRLLEFSAEQETDVMLVGHELSKPGRQALARRLAMKAPCSVWMVPEGVPAQLNRLLVPVDFSDHSADAMNVATTLARLTGDSECLVLHVMNLGEAFITDESYAEKFREEHQQAYREFIGGVDCQGVAVETLFEEGSRVSPVILDIADQREVDLTIMSSRGRTNSAAILLGSVTESVIVQHMRPLLVVKHFGAQLGLIEVLLGKGFHKKPGG